MPEPPAAQQALLRDGIDRVLCIGFEDEAIRKCLLFLRCHLAHALTRIIFRRYKRIKVWFASVRRDRKCQRDFIAIVAADILVQTLRVAIGSRRLQES